MAFGRASALGIDIGSAFIRVATAIDGVASIVTGPDGNASTPSAVSFARDRVALGTQALARAATHPSATVLDPALALGRGMLRIDGVERAPASVLGLVLRGACDRGGDDTANARATVFSTSRPAEGIVNELRAAAEIAKLSFGGVEEGAALAGLAFAADRGLTQARFAIVDAGHSRCEVAFVAVARDHVQLLGHAVDATACASALDERLVLRIARSLDPARGESWLRDASLRELLRQAAEGARRQLDQLASVEVPLPFVGALLRMPTAPVWQVGREALFEDMGPTFAGIEAVARQAMADSGIRSGDFDHLLVLGGLSRTPVVRDHVERLFGRARAGGVDPTALVARGAAMLAAASGDVGAVIRRGAAAAVERSSPVPAAPRGAVPPSQPTRSAASASARGVIAPPPLSSAGGPATPGPKSPGVPGSSPMGGIPSYRVAAPQRGGRGPAPTTSQVLRGGPVPPPSERASVPNVPSSQRGAPPDRPSSPRGPNVPPSSQRRSGPPSSAVGTPLPGRSPLAPPVVPASQDLRGRLTPEPRAQRTPLAPPASSEAGSSRSPVLTPRLGSTTTTWTGRSATSSIPTPLPEPTPVPSRFDDAPSTEPVPPPSQSAEPATDPAAPPVPSVAPRSAGASAPPRRPGMTPIPAREPIAPPAPPAAAPVVSTLVSARARDDDERPSHAAEGRVQVSIETPTPAAQPPVAPRAAKPGVDTLILGSAAHEGSLPPLPPAPSALARPVPSSGVRATGAIDEAPPLPMAASGGAHTTAVSVAAPVDRATPTSPSDRRSDPGVARGSQPSVSRSNAATAPAPPVQRQSALPTAAPPARESGAPTVAPPAGLTRATVQASFARAGSVAVPVEGKFVGATTLAAWRALPLTRTLIESDVETPALPVVLLHVAKRGDSTGVLHVVSSGLAFDLPIVRGAPAMTRAERDILRAVFEWTAGSYEWRPDGQPPEGHGRQREPMVAVVARGFRAAARAAGEAGLAHDLAPVVDLVPALRPERAVLVAQLGLSPDETQLIGERFDGVTPAIAIVEDGSLPREVVLELFALLDVFGAIEWS